MHEKLMKEWQTNWKTRLSDFSLVFEHDPASSIHLDRIACQNHKDVFEQTDCLVCANCCRTAPPIIIPEDVRKIAASLKINRGEFIRKYTLTDVDGEMSFKNVPCVFLGKDNACQIYEIRPLACREYPHTDAPGFKRKRKLHLANVGICPAVYHILDRMVDAIGKDFKTDL